MKTRQRIAVGLIVLGAGILSGVFLSGCGLKAQKKLAGSDSQIETHTSSKSDTESQENREDTAGLLQMGWGEELKSAQYIAHTKRNLIKKSQFEFESKTPITIPANVPKELTVFFSFKTDIQSPEIIRASFENESGGYELDVKLHRDFDAAEGSFSFSLLGLETAMSAQMQSRGNLKIQGYASTGKEWTVSLNLRTPPSAAKIGFQTLSRFLSQNKNSEKDRFQQIQIENKTMQLIGVVSAENQNDTSLVMTLPRRAGAKLVQKIKDIQYRDLGCSYSLDENLGFQDLSNDFILLPLDSSLHPEALKSMQRIDLDDSLELQLNSNKAAFFGVYAMGEDVSSWIKSGPKSSSLTNREGLGACHSECTRQECNHHGGGDHKFPVFDQPLCTCEEYRNWRDTVQVSVGRERSDVGIQWSDKGIEALVNYADVSFAQRGEARVGLRFQGFQVLNP